MTPERVLLQLIVTEYDGDCEPAEWERVMADARALLAAEYTEPAPAIWQVPYAPETPTLRDQFAMAAFPIILAEARRDNWAQHGEDWLVQCGLEAYRAADAAMLAHRERQGGA